MLNKNRSVFVLLEGVNFGGQQLYIYNLFKNIKQIDSKIELNAGYLFNESIDLYPQLKEVFNSVLLCGLHSRSKKLLFLKPVKSILNAVNIIREIRNLKPDVVFSNGFYSFFFCVLYRFLNSKVLHFRMIGGDLVRNESFYHENQFLKLAFPLYSYTDKIFGFHDNKTYYEQLDIDTSKVVFDYMPTAAVDSDLFTPIGEDLANTIRSNYCIDNAEFTIGWVGRISDDKEIWETVEVCSYIKEKYGHIKFKFIVIGDGWKRDELERLIKLKNLSNEYLRVDATTQSELVKLYSLIDFELLLDKDPQGGSHIREAMSCGRIAVSVDGSSKVQSKLIENEVTGYLVKPENRVEDAAELIIKLHKDKDKLRQVGINARMFIQNNSYHKLASILLREMF